jgi:hypothetical protein
MNGLREQFELDEHAESLRDRVAHWEHHRAASLQATDDVGQLHGLMNEMHQAEEDRRNAEHLGS